MISSLLERSLTSLLIHVPPTDVDLRWAENHYLSSQNTGHVTSVTSHHICEFGFEQFLQEVKENSEPWHRFKLIIQAKKKLHTRPTSLSPCFRQFLSLCFETGSLSYVLGLTDQPVPGSFCVFFSMVVSKGTMLIIQRTEIRITEEEGRLDREWSVGPPLQLGQRDNLK